MSVQLLRRREAADRLGVSIRQLENWIAEGRIKVHRLGSRCVRIDERELVRLLKSA